MESELQIGPSQTSPAIRCSLSPLLFILFVCCLLMANAVPDYFHSGLPILSVFMCLFLWHFVFGFLLIFLFVSYCCSTWYCYNTIGVCVAFSMCLSVAMVMSDLVSFFCFVYLFVSQSHCCAQCKLFVNQQLFVLLVHVWVGPHSGVNCYLCLCVFLYLALFVCITLL